MDMDDISIPAIKARLTTRFVGRNLLYYPTIGSTNDVAKAQGRAGAPEGTVVLADEQTSGRGRLQRPWLSPAGSSLLLSVLLRPTPVELPRLTMVASVAVARSIEAILGLRPGLKWHNDVMLGRRKVCGILVESDLVEDQVSFAVVGIGLNVNFDPASFPEIANMATSLQRELGHAVPRLPLLLRLLEEIETLYLAERQGQSVFIEWRARLDTLGRAVRVAMGDHVEEGVAEDVDEEGRLLLRRPDGSLLTVIAGDVTLREV